MIATPGQPALLSMLASDGNVSLYGQAIVYDAAGAVAATVNLNLVAGGLYTGSWTPATEGFYSVVCKFYTDIGRTTAASYEVQGETVDVSSIKTNILRLLGLTHENSVIDAQIYNDSGDIVSARIRCYNSAVNCAAASAASPATYLTGMLFEYRVFALYQAGVLKNYRIERVS